MNISHMHSQRYPQPIMGQKHQILYYTQVLGNTTFNTPLNTLNGYSITKSARHSALVRMLKPELK